jgi:hypothetical protein
MIATNAHGVAGAMINDWRVDWIVNDQSGVPVAFPNSYLYTCGNYKVAPAHKTWGTYLNNSSPNCFTGFPEYTAITQGPYTTVVRTPWAEQSQVAVQKDFAIRERERLQFRAEAFNLTNTPIFNGPNTGNPNAAIQPVAGIMPGQPGAYTGYGTVGNSTVNSPRQVQLSLKVLF